jgi:hypothetical protein
MRMKRIGVLLGAMASIPFGFGLPMAGLDEYAMRG